MPRASYASSAADYDKARSLYYALKENQNKQQYRHHWLKVIAAFRSVVRAHPKSHEAPRAQFMVAELWRSLFSISRKRADEDEAFDAYARVAAVYAAAKIPQRQWVLADDGLWWRAGILERRVQLPEAAAELLTLGKRYPKGDMAKKAKILLATPAFADITPSVLDPTTDTQEPAHATSDKSQVAGRRGTTAARVTEMRQWAGKDYIRVAVYFSGPVRARSHVLPARGSEPSRIYVDVSEAIANKREEAKVDGALLTSFRAVQFNKTTVRIVLDLEAPARHRLMVMENPFRVVVDIDRESTLRPHAAKRTSKKPKSAAKTSPKEGVLLRAGRTDGGDCRSGHDPKLKGDCAALSARDISRSAQPKLSSYHVVIDPGHGGKDTGAVSKYATEKTVALHIAKIAATVLRQKGVVVHMTRDDDTFVALEGRAAIANKHNADLFVSVHANAAKKSSVHGIETYFLNVTDNRYALRLAAVENKTSEDDVSDLQLILTDMSTKAHTAESQVLAKSIQKKLMAGAKRQNKNAKDNGVKASLFYVLLGARMPAVLVETSFLTNPIEGKLLGTSSYRQVLGKALGEAILEHLKTQTQMRAAQPPL